MYSAGNSTLNCGRLTFRQNVAPSRCGGIATLSLPARVAHLELSFDHVGAIDLIIVQA
jgi:hypothetical protein